MENLSTAEQPMQPLPIWVLRAGLVSPSPPAAQANDNRSRRFTARYLATKKVHIEQAAKVIVGRIGHHKYLLNQMVPAMRREGISGCLALPWLCPAGPFDPYRAWCAYVRIARICTYMHIYTSTDINMCIYIHIRSYIHIWIYVHIRAYTCIYVYTFIYAHTCIYVQYMHIRAYTCTHVYT